MNMTRKASRALLIVAALITGLTLSACSGAHMIAEEFGRAMAGTGGTYRTYDKTGHVMDEVNGTTIRVTRDDRFDEVNSDGSTSPGSMIQVQVGQNFINHVGSTAVLFEKGLLVVTPAEKGFDVNSNASGTPWLDKFMEGNRNLWSGSAKTVLVRTQDDVPVAIFAGKNVEFVGSDIPKSTVLRVTQADGSVKYALVYRANLTIYDTALLGN